MLDHSFYFAEAVRVVIESKSRWSMQDWRDVQEKTRAVRSIHLEYSRTMEDEIHMLKLDVAALKTQREHNGMIISRPKIGTAAVFIEGGGDFLKDPESIPEDLIEDADEAWPDVALFLREGVLIAKQDSDDEPQITFWRLGDNSLLGFTNSLLRMLSARTVSSQGHFYMDNYMRSIVEAEPYARIPYHGGFWPAGRTPIW